MTTVNRIKQIAKEQGRSLTYLCKQLGFTSRTYFNDVEKNNREIPIEKLTQIADLLGVTVDYLLGKSDVPNPQIPQEPAIPEDSVVFHLNGKLGKKKLTKEQATIIQAMLDAIPDTPLDN
ncbi:MAG: helix-turn-helix transcriptional regulator [Clostridia bacterium]|nr:helix-turn-helix transcriptional regulator [Clostridia bacterium]